MAARTAGRSRMVRAGRACAAIVALSIAMIGCTRSYYRNYADKDVYAIERERDLDPRWRVPNRPVEADIRARIGDPFNPDKEPVPLDDPAARLFQVTNGRHGEFHHWQKRGVADVERQEWRALLPTNPDGSVRLSRESAIQVALLNSRDYQTQVETLYLTALSLTLSRYEFYLQPFARQGTVFNQMGGGKNETNQLLLNGTTGFTQNFASGGQLLVDFANAMVFQFNNHGFSTVTSNLAVTFTQPLIRGAFAKYRTQALSLAERQTLYAVRDFARFRRAFYVNIIAQGGFLGLLQQVQSIRNQEEQVRTLARNLAEQEELEKAGAVAQKDRDLIAQNYQQSQFDLLQLQANLEVSLDNYKYLQLGLPTEIEIKIDESLLKTFELYDPALDAIRTRSEARFLALLQPEKAPPNPVLLESIGDLKGLYATLESVLTTAEGEVRTWRKRLGQIDKADEELPLPVIPPGTDPDEASQIKLANGLARTLRETRVLLNSDLEDLAALTAAIDRGDPEENWQKLRDLYNKKFRSRLSDVFVSQTQARVYLIELPPVELTSEEAVLLALENRLDIMNARARVTDAWRNEELAANRLLADLNVVYQGNLGTDPKHDGIFQFDSANSSHKIGLQFDAPLIRRAERNGYKSSQIAYQQARRAWMLARDQAVFQLRNDIRQLTLNRRQFEISRVQLIINARRVEEAEYDQRTKRTTESSNSLLLVQALQSLLSSKNSLIGNWVTYQTLRMNLYRDLDLMDIDSQGVWVNEHDSLSRGANAAAPAESPPYNTPVADPPR